jgi:hypothetical protein
MLSFEGRVNGALYGASHGVRALPERLRKDVDAANRRDFGAQASAFAWLARELLARDARQTALQEAK